MRLLIAAEFLGVSGKEVDSFKEYLEYNETEIAFDFVVNRLYNNNIEISPDVYRLICNISGLLALSNSEYDFIRELIRDDNKIPEPVKLGITKLIGSLDQPRPTDMDL
ncbi:MafI family immunity protein [Mucilaginibacter myungsuensis]|nr:MafI family immunity protein [Mucilaginibacter myungsuensis]MDN3600520.1 MafI family immunity protein [Mucilaginibacter myungsuensis]